MDQLNNINIMCFLHLTIYKQYKLHVFEKMHTMAYANPLLTIRQAHGTVISKARWFLVSSDAISYKI